VTCYADAVDSRVAAASVRRITQPQRRTWAHTADHEVGTFSRPPPWNSQGWSRNDAPQSAMRSSLTAKIERPRLTHARLPSRLALLGTYVRTWAVSSSRKRNELETKFDFLKRSWHPPPLSASRHSRVRGWIWDVFSVPGSRPCG
jgi:hypothetical protein